MGTSHAISADMKVAVQRAIGDLTSAQFIDKSDCAFQLEVAVSELVDLWVLFPLKPTDLEVSLRMAQIEFITNALCVTLGRTRQLSNAIEMSSCGDLAIT